MFMASCRFRKTVACSLQVCSLLGLLNNFRQLYKPTSAIRLPRLGNCQALLRVRLDLRYGLLGSVAIFAITLWRDSSWDFLKRQPIAFSINTVWLIFVIIKVKVISIASADIPSSNISMPLLRTHVKKFV